MRLESNVIFKGEFWLASDPDSKVDGVLEIENGGDISLSLSRVFPSAENINSDLGNIVGFNKQEGYLTLFDNFYTRASFLGADVSIVSNLAIFGAGYDDSSSPLFNSSRIKIDGLQHFFSESGLSCVDQENSVSYIKPDLKKFEFKGGELTFNSVCNIESGQYSKYFKEFCVAELIFFDDVDIEKLQSYVNSVQIFLEVVFGFKISLVSLYADSGFYLENGERNPVGDNDKLVRQKIYYATYLTNEKRNRYRDMLFPLSSVNDDVFFRWFEFSAMNRECVNLFTNSLNSVNADVDNRFLRIMQCLETFLRLGDFGTHFTEDEFQEYLAQTIEGAPEKFRDIVRNTLKSKNEVQLRKKIQKSIKKEFVKNLFGNSKEIDSFVNKIVNTRNYYTHWSKGPSDKVLEGRDIWVASNKLEWLVRALFLEYVGFTSEQIQDFGQHHSVQRRFKQ